MGYLTINIVAINFYIDVRFNVRTIQRDVRLES